MFISSVIVCWGRLFEHVLRVFGWFVGTCLKVCLCELFWWFASGVWSSFCRGGFSGSCWFPSVRLS